MSSNIGVDVLNILLTLTSSSSESSDDEIIQMLMDDSDSEEELILAELAKSLPTTQNCISNFLNHVVPNYSEVEFMRHFRVSTSLFERLCDTMEQSEEYKALRLDKRLPAKMHIAVFLWFAGNEACSYRDVGSRFDLSISSVCRVIHRTSMFLSNMAPSVIEWPSEESKQESSKFFGKKCGFDKAIGCIDAIRIVIDTPSTRKEDYIDSKGNASLCVQAICNENKKFINVFIGHPGACQDSWILKYSPIFKKLQSVCGDYYLLGDSAYPCTQHLITPYRDDGQLSSAQKDFNIKLNSGRVAIDHSFGILKQRFRQLYYCKLKGIEKLCHFIMACCVLHNIADESDLDLLNEEKEKEEKEEDGEDIYDEELEDEFLQTNDSIREAILKQLQN